MSFTIGKELKPFLTLRRINGIKQKTSVLGYDVVLSHTPGVKWFVYQDLTKLLWYCVDSYLGLGIKNGTSKRGAIEAVIAKVESGIGWEEFAIRYAEEKRNSDGEDDLNALEVL